MTTRTESGGNLVIHTNLTDACVLEVSYHDLELIRGHILHVVSLSEAPPSLTAGWPGLVPPLCIAALAL